MSIVVVSLVGKAGHYSNLPHGIIYIIHMFNDDREKVTNRTPTSLPPNLKHGRVVVTSEITILSFNSHHLVIKFKFNILM